MTTINPVGSDNQQTSPALVVGGSAVVGAGAGAAGKYFKPVDMESNDVLDIAKKKTADDKKGFAKLIEDAKEKLFPKTEEGKPAPKATKFEELDDATKKAFKEAGIEKADNVKEVTDVDDALKTLKQQSEALTGEHVKMSDDAFQTMQTALKDAQGNLGKVVAKDGTLLKEGKDVETAMKALKESSDNNVRQMVEILGQEGNAKLSDAQKAFVNGLGIEEFKIDDSTTIADVRKNLSKFDPEKYAESVKKKANELAQVAEDQTKSIKEALKNDENFKNAVKSIARKQGIWKWAGIGAAALAAVGLAYTYFTKTDKTA